MSKVYGSWMSESVEKKLGSAKTNRIMYDFSQFASMLKVIMNLCWGVYPSWAVSTLLCFHKLRKRQQYMEKVQVWPWVLDVSLLDHTGRIHRDSNSAFANVPCGGHKFCVCYRVYMS